MFHITPKPRARYSKRPPRVRFVNPVSYVEEVGEEIPIPVRHRPRLMTMNVPSDTKFRPSTLLHRVLPTPGSVANLRLPDPSEIIDFSATSSRVDPGTDTGATTSLLRIGSFNPFGHSFQTMLGILQSKSMAAIKRDPLFNALERLEEIERIKKVEALKEKLEQEAAATAEVANLSTAAQPSPLAQEVVNVGNENIPQAPPAPPAPPPPVGISPLTFDEAVKQYNRVPVKRSSQPIKRPRDYREDMNVETLRELRTNLKHVDREEKPQEYPTFIHPELHEELLRKVHRYD